MLQRIFEIKGPYIKRRQSYFTQNSPRNRESRQAHTKWATGPRTPDVIGKEMGHWRSYIAGVRKNEKQHWSSWESRHRASAHSFEKVSFMYNAGAGWRLGRAHHSRECIMLRLSWRVKVKVTQSCWTLCDPMDYTVHGILQARILEWAAIPFSRGFSQLRSLTLQAESLSLEPTRDVPIC